MYYVLTNVLTLLIRGAVHPKTKILILTIIMLIIIIIIIM